MTNAGVGEEQQLASLSRIIFVKISWSPSAFVIFCFVGMGCNQMYNLHCVKCIIGVQNMINWQPLDHSY